MSEEKQSADFAELIEIVSQYTMWYDQVLRSCFYPDEETALSNAVIQDFLTWTDRALDKDTISHEIFQKLKSMHEDLHQHVEKMIWNTQSKKHAPDISDFDQMTSYYEEFLNNLRRLERDSSVENTGIDVITGLRNKAIMHSDLEKEMERLSRRGKPFCLALTRIDQHALVKKQDGPEKAQEYTKRVAQLVKRSMRSFDDGYRIGNGEFILSLKQADISGGLAALERLRALLETQNIQVELEGRTIPMTVSCCIAEPVPGDNVDELLKNLRADLVTIKDDKGAVLEYYEMSPLQRYVQGENA